VEGDVGFEVGGGGSEGVVGDGAVGTDGEDCEDCEEGQLHALPVHAQPLPRRHASSAEF